MNVEEKCKFELIDLPRDLHGTKAVWYCNVHHIRASSEKECRRKQSEKLLKEDLK